MKMPMAALRPPLSPRRVAARIWPGLDEPIAGKTIMVTGASSGMGRSAARQLAGLGAEVVVVARREDELASLQAEIRAAGGKAEYRVCDIADYGQVDELIEWTDERGGVDVLVNNAGRSIRRPLVETFDRFHDFERTMAINYFGPVRLTMGLLPSMVERGNGQVVNVGTWTVTMDSSPGFAAYQSSKAAFTAFSRCANAELTAHGVHVTMVQFPLVHTAMSAPTEALREMTGLPLEEAAGWIVDAIKRRPIRIEPRIARNFRLLGTFAPAKVDEILGGLGA